MAINPEYGNILQTGLDLPDEKKFYFNGFLISITPPDVIIILQNNNRPIAYLNVSHTIAKTFANTLQSLLKDFEKDTKRKILTLDEIQKLVGKNAKPETDT